MTVIDDIKGRLDILDVVSRYANLQRSGRSYKANCPFHTERTPSFHVFPERQSWRCFGACATGGDLFSFLMRIENLEFGEALKVLAQQAGVTLPEKRERKDENDAIYSINEASREFFSGLLSSGGRGADARAYLLERGLEQGTIERFQLGLSPSDGESLRRHLASKGYTQEQMALAGVVTQGRNGSYRDLFRSRLMFPIWDAEGRLAGFGGRALDDSGPKYLNSPRSPAFDKGRILYAMHLAKDAVRERGIVIVEGYMDAIVAHQGGFSNVVASMGTALTQHQASLVRGLVRKPGSSDPGDVILALDPDDAGNKATSGGLESESSLNALQTVFKGRVGRTNFYERPDSPSFRVALLPHGKDPDEIILESPEEWTRLVANAVPFMDYLFAVYSSSEDLSTPQGKSRVADKFKLFIAATPDPFEQDHYFQRLAALLEVSDATLRASLGRPGPGGPSNRDRSTGPNRTTRSQPGRVDRQDQDTTATPFARMDHDPLEEYCMALILRDSEFLHPDGHGKNGSGETESAGFTEEAGDAYKLRLEYFQRVDNRDVFTNWIRCSTLDTLRDSLDEELKEHLEHLLTKFLPPSDRKQREAAFKDCVRRLEERYLRDLKREEGMRLSEATVEEVEEQGQEILQLNERLKKVYGR
ncbi:MAG: DNA primase [Dehalococcoidia bacterium]|nr:DNA primase [Dehalococcoidia bacterium]